MYVCICMYVYVCVYVCVYMYACMYVCMYMCVKAYMYVCMHNISGGNVRGGKCPTQNGRGIVRRVIVRRNCPGGELSYTRKKQLLARSARRLLCLENVFLV